MDVKEEWPADKYLIEKGKSGQLQVIDIFTGLVVAEHKPEKAMIPHTGVDGTVAYVPESSDPATRNSIQGGVFVFSWPLAQYVCQKIAEGMLITKTGEHGLPSYSLISLWRKGNERFDKMIKQAEVDRGDHYFAKAMETVDMITKDLDTAPTQKTIHDIHKWAAKTSNPEKYGDKQTTEFSDKPLRIILDTGIRRNPPKDVVDGKTDPEVQVHDKAITDISGNASRGK